MLRDARDVAGENPTPHKDALDIPLGDLRVGVEFLAKRPTGALVGALWRAYAGHRVVAAEDRALLYVELRAAAVRFMVTRITDVYLPGAALAGKDFRRFLSRLEAWRAIGEGGLAAWLA